MQNQYYGQYKIHLQQQTYKTNLPQEFLQDINLHVDTYMEALQISHKGPSIILK